jgi:DNA-directed RNA polymerase subunit RPC12/RpoP
MTVCAHCGNDYDKAFTVTTADGTSQSFDSFECAIHMLAPTCAHCGMRIIGHGVEAGGSIYCCAHCARHAGITQLQDRA